jgi:hypothetical protein
MRKEWLLSLTVVALLAASGCMEMTTEVEVQQDGSGTITETMYMSQQMMAMMSGMGGEQGGPKLVDRAKLEARAKKMGEGVTLEEAKEVEKDGRKGAIAVYAFEDINKVELDPTPGGGQGGMGGMSQSQQAQAENEPLTFKYADGELVINMPRPEQTEGEETPEPKKMTPQQKAQMQQMRQMFAGMRFWLRLRVDGTITETNAEYVNKDKDGITLMDLRIGDLMQDDEKLERMMELQGVKDMAVIREKTKDIPEMRFEPAENVRVVFE